MKIKVEAIIEIDDMIMFGGDFKDADKETKDWFNSVLNHKEDSLLVLWNNDIGDELGFTKEFKREILDND